MSTRSPNNPAVPEEELGRHEPGNHGHLAHRWMMLACCVPMLVVVGALLVSGVASTGAIVFAVLCVLMMWLMMKVLP